MISLENKALRKSAKSARKTTRSLSSKTRNVSDRNKKYTAFFSANFASLREKLREICEKQK